MAVLATGSFPKELDKAIDKVWNDEYMAVPTLYDKVFKVISSFEGKEIRESELSSIGAMRTLAEGDKVTMDTLVEGNERAAIPTQYGLAIQITQNMWEDDSRHGNIRKAAGELGKSAAWKTETACWDHFNSGFTVHTAWDSNYYWVKTGRTTLKSGEDMNNRPTTDASLSETTLNAAMEYYKTAINSSGRPIMLRMKTLIIPTELSSVAWQLHENRSKPGSMTNDLNTLNRDGTWNVLEVVYLTSPTAWFTIADGQDFRIAWKRSPKVQQGDDFLTGNRIAKSTSRFAVCMFNPIATYATTGA